MVSRCSEEKPNLVASSEAQVWAAAEPCLMAAKSLEVSPSDQTKGEPQQRLIPYVKGPIVTQVDLDAKTIWVEWGEDY